jgi:DNA-binding CsgD family transcriptional regulator
MENLNGYITRRELEILEHIVKGLSDRQISEKIGITIHTVNAYRKSLLKKLNANNVASLVRIAILKDMVKL